jgi:hypothetical protein
MEGRWSRGRVGQLIGRLGRDAIRGEKENADEYRGSRLYIEGEECNCS